MARKDIVVIGASAGGMEALQKVVAGLPRDLPAAVFVVWHLSPNVRSVLPEVLARAGLMPAIHPLDGDRIEPGRIYVGPNNHHMLLDDSRIRVVKGPKENRFRPAIDPLFRSAAYVYGSRVIGIVLSGALDDGTSGLWTIKMRGGTAIVQEPSDAQHRSMPLHALEYTKADHTVPAAAIGPLLARLVHEEAPQSAPPTPREETLLRREVEIAVGHEALEENIFSFGELTAFTCPECRGVLTRLQEGRLVRYRCHTGHAFGSDTLLDAVTEAVEDRLWDSLRALDEAIIIMNRLGQEFAQAGRTEAAGQLFDKARDAYGRAKVIREAAQSNEHVSLDQVREAPRPAEPTGPGRAPNARRKRLARSGRT